MQHRIELDCEVRTVDKLTQLDHLAQGHFVRKVQARRLNKLIVRFVGEVKNFAVNVNAVDKTAEVQEILDFEWSLDFTKV